MSPTRAQQLTPRSSPEEIQIAISAAVSLFVREGREQAQAIAIAYEQARKATGKALEPKGG